ncbi:nuclear RNA export factor 2-like [Copidosoma floridanum]|uniref:nuclear RNA export factor 2-like n=1 Tax=Copidosoma floridanum TaxID=29053 RepID=UPI0006C94ACA|nr:nuclear RNA export factor 2-like [Copidosoma floridanum]
MMYRDTLVNLLKPHSGQIQQQNPHVPLQQNIIMPHSQIGGSPPIPVILDSNAAMSLAMGTSMYHERSLMARNDIWHRILILRGGLYDKEVILKSILKAVNPADLIPVKYQIIGEDSCFIARNCDRALDSLCKTSLIVNCPDGNPVILSITLGFASIHDLKINIQPLLLTALKKRYDSESKKLDLTDFHRDPDVYNTVYCPLAQTKTLTHVLKLAKTAFGSIDYINLQSNELTSLMLVDTANIKSLKCMDLRDNYFLRVEALEPLKAINISEIWLDGNPMCDNYSRANQYVEAIRQYFPHMTKLDGVQISAPGMPLIFKSYVKNYQRKYLIEQFVYHFFRAYDFSDRNVLKGLYDTNAWYSTTVGTPTSPTTKRALEPFGPENRNLLIFGKNSQQLLYHGQDQILKVFKNLPPSQHIHRSLCCDLMYDSDQMIIISVEGLFKSMLALNQLFSFNRTFVLVAKEENEYKIINDQYHVNPPIQMADHFKYNLEKEVIPEYEPNCFSPSEKENLILSLQEKTTMGVETCEKYLKEANWSLKKAITNFLNHHKNGLIPKDCYK